jgi:hypothetical protein
MDKSSRLGLELRDFYSSTSDDGKDNTSDLLSTRICSPEVFLEILRITVQLGNSRERNSCVSCKGIVMVNSNVASSYMILLVLVF